IKTKSPLISKNPIGWLRKSIEEKYSAPKHYTAKKDETEKNQKTVKKSDKIRLLRKNLPEEELQAIREKAIKACKERLGVILKGKEPMEAMIEGQIYEILTEQLNENK
ncbi:MAG: hypothetical protein ABIF89_00200, partial [bacterium]